MLNKFYINVLVIVTFFIVTVLHDYVMCIMRPVFSITCMDNTLMFCITLVVSAKYLLAYMQ